MEEEKGRGEGGGEGWRREGRVEEEEELMNSKYIERRGTREGGGERERIGYRACRRESGLRIRRMLGGGGGAIGGHAPGHPVVSGAHTESEGGCVGFPSSAAPWSRPLSQSPRSPPNSGPQYTGSWVVWCVG